MARLRYEDLDPDTRKRIRDKGIQVPDDEPKPAPAPKPAPPPSTARAPRSAPSRPARRPAPRRSSSASSGSVTDAGSGWILGLIAYALFRSYVVYGPPGPKGWLAAKFINRPLVPAGPGFVNGAWANVTAGLTQAAQTVGAAAAANQRRP